MGTNTRRIASHVLRRNCLVAAAFGSAALLLGACAHDGPAAPDVGRASLAVGSLADCSKDPGDHVPPPKEPGGGGGSIPPWWIQVSECTDVPTDPGAPGSPWFPAPPDGGGGGQNPEGGGTGGGGTPGWGGGGSGCPTLLRERFDLPQTAVLGLITDPCSTPRGVGQPPRFPDEVADYLREIGIPPDVVDDISWQEKLTCLKYLAACATVYRLVPAARQWSRDNATRDPQGSENGQRDGYRHVHWLSHMTNLLGAAIAAEWGEAHEAGHPGSAFANAMDRRNNLLGVELGNSVGRLMIVDLPTLILQADVACRIVYVGPGRCPDR